MQIVPFRPLTALSPDDVWAGGSLQPLDPQLQDTYPADKRYCH